MKRDQEFISEFLFLFCEASLFFSSTDNQEKGADQKKLILHTNTYSYS